MWYSTEQSLVQTLIRLLTHRTDRLRSNRFLALIVMICLVSGLFRGMEAPRFFPAIFTREISFVALCLLPVNQVPSKRGSIYRYFALKRIVAPTGFNVPLIN